jgi:GDPmannose 4,6-dehydratase
MFGKVQQVPQSEDTPFYPRSPYGVAKVMAHQACVNYREAYNMHISCGILFNHEGEKRGYEFVTRKITQAVAQIYLGITNELRLGNLDTKRDWGYAGDYVDAMWRMVQQEVPSDYVIATGETHSVREFLEEAFRVVGVTDGIDRYVKIDSKFMRPSEVYLLVGDASKARNHLHWKSTTDFKQLVKLMVDNDLRIEMNKAAR